MSNEIDVSLDGIDPRGVKAQIHIKELIDA